MAKSPPFAAAFAFLIAAATPLFAAVVPRPAGDLALHLQKGQEQLLSGYKGKIILLDFLYTDCVQCQKTAEFLNQIEKEYSGRGVQVISVAFDKGAAARAASFSKVFSLSYPLGTSDEKSVLAFIQQPASEPYLVPIMVFIDRDFHIRSQYVGDADFIHEEQTRVRAELDRLLK